MKELEEIFFSAPTLVCQLSIDAYTRLGPIPINKWISEGKLQQDSSLEIKKMQGKNDGWESKYHGQVNSEGKLSGIGRLERVDKSLVEGFFVEGKLHGQGRILRINGTVEEGIFKNNTLV